jgi:PAS domain S-box-containing protein
MRYTSSIWLLLVTVLLLLVLAIYSWRRRSVPGALQFMAGCLFTVLATTGMLMANLVVEPEAKIFWFRFQASWLPPGATAITCFVLEYACPGRWLSRRNLLLLSIMPLFFIVYFLGGAYALGEPINFSVGETVSAPVTAVGSIVAVYLLALTLVNLAVFGWLFMHSPQHRWVIVLMAASQIIARLIVLGDIPSLGVRIINIPTLALPYLVYAIALFGFRIFDPVSLARQIAIDHLHAGMVVLDPQGRVVSLNSAAERILGANTRQARGMPVRQWLPVYSEDLREKPDGTEIEFRLEAGAALRHYTLAASPLNDFRGLRVGSLLMLRDITEQKQAQAQILEQQNALAALQERERLARDLHDSIGQVLGYAGLQLEMVNDSLQLSQAAFERNQAAEPDTRLLEARNQITRLEKIVLEAHADLREYILNLRSGPSGKLSFSDALQLYLDGFRINYGIQVQFSAAPELNEKAFTQDRQMHIFRIIQEALSNVRKHAAASCVVISLTCQEGLARLLIEDNGQGFDPDRAAEKGHFGLAIMRERAGLMGGSLTVTAAPGKGTQILVEVPCQEAGPEENNEDSDCG